MNTQKKVHHIPTADSALIQHETHLPEVAWCRCGYVRDELTVEAAELVTAN